MLTRVIVPLDGSAGAERALPLAARLARCAGGTVWLIRAVRSSHHHDIGHDTGLEASLVPPSALAAKRAERYLTRTAAILREHNVSVETTVRGGAPAEAILWAARQAGSSLVLLSSRGRTTRGRWLIGSVAREVLRASPVPVLIVRPDGRALPPASRYTALPQSPLCALVPLDGSPAAEAALRPALRLVETLAAPGEGHIHLVHVSPAFGGDWGMERDAAEQYLRTVADRVSFALPQASGHSVTWSVVYETEPALALMRLAAQGNADASVPQADVLVMATHGVGGIERRLLGGVTEQMLHATRIPVLVVRPDNLALPTAKTFDGQSASAIEAADLMDDELIDERSAPCALLVP